MKTKYLTSLAMAALLLAACSDEQEFASTPSGEGVLRATVEGASPATRAGFGENGAFYWTTGDQLGVTTTSSSNSFSALTLQSGAGQASGTFDGKISGELGSYAVYPYSASHSLSSTTLTYNFPATYSYTKVDADFFSATQGEGNSFNPAMWGSISNGSTQLKHLGGVFCIKIEKMPLTDGILTLTADKAITGTFTVDLSGETPALTSTATASENNAVSIDFEGATLEASGVFYVPVPTGTYNVRIKVTDDSNTTPAEIDAAVGTYTVNRCDLKQITLTESSIDAEPADDLSAAATDLGTHDNVTVSGQVSSTQSIEIPSTTGGAEVTKTLSLQDVASGASLTITDGAGSTTSNSVENLVFSIPTNETEEYEPLDLTVTMPNTTVTLAGNGGKATYGEVTASTAENTLIVSAGVSINKLTVTKGNIRLQGDAAISEIVNSKGSDAKLYIYVEGEGYELPENLGDNIEVVDASVDDLKEICATGGEYTLNSDITGDFVVSATEPVIINLNGHTITNVSGDNFTVNIGSTLTINGEGIVDNISHQKACIYNNGTVTLNGGTYTRSKETGSSPTDPGTDSNSFYNILNHGIMTIKAGVTVEQAGGFSSLIDNGYYNYTSGNARTGYVSGTNHANPSLTIEGGEFQGGINTVKNDDGATLTINDGTFANTTQATVQNNNVVTINGGTFNPTGTATDALQTRYFDGGNNAGQSTITNGTFNGKLYFEGASATLEVSGGTFTDPSALAYLSENANVKMVLSDNLTLEQSIVIEKGTVTVDLQEHTLTAESTATINVSDKNRITAIAVRDGASVTIQNGQIGNDTDALFYGIYAYGSAQITLTDINFGEKVTYAYNGAGDLTASGCTFKGWLSGWSQGGAEFTDCTFTIGKAYYPAAICYGSTEFTNCKFFNNNTDADVYDDGGAPDSDGYYRCNYVVAAYNSGTTIDFNSCKFIDASGAETNITTESHPYHGCGWGDGTVPPSQIKVDGNVVTGQCSDLQKAQEAGGTTEE